MQIHARSTYHARGTPHRAAGFVIQRDSKKMLHRLPPLPRVSIDPAHSGVLTGHWEFDLALAMIFFAAITYSFLLPADAPKGGGRIAIQSVAVVLFIGAIVLAIVGFRNL